MQERRRTPAGPVLAALQTTLVAESPSGPPAHVTPALENKARQGGSLANLVEQEVCGPGKPVKDGYLAAAGNGIALGPRTERAPEIPRRIVHAFVYDVAHKEPVSNYKTNTTRSPVIQLCGRGFPVRGSGACSHASSLFVVARRGYCAGRPPDASSLLLAYLTRGRDEIKVVCICVHPADT
jgi:hypothetical protein